MSLADNLTKQITDLRRERTRIEEQATKDLESVDVQLEALEAASKVLTKDVEESYALLIRLKLIQAVTR